MTNTPLVQFAGFTSKLETNAFLEQWKAYAGIFEQQSAGITLWQQRQTRGRYNYISLLHWQGEDFQFSFMGRRRSDYFPDRTVRVIQGGGYCEKGLNGSMPVTDGSLMVIVLVPGRTFEMDVLAPEGHSGWRRDYRAFYESCLFSQVVCLGATENSLTHILETVKKHDGVETGVYSLCYTSPGLTEKANNGKKSSGKV